MILNTLSCMAAGMILASAGVSVTNSWQAWAIIVIVGINGARKEWK